MYQELLRLDSLENQKALSHAEPLTFTLLEGESTCLFAQDFNVKHFLLRALNGKSGGYDGTIYIDGARVELSSLETARGYGIYDADPLDLFDNMDVAVNLFLPDFPVLGNRLSLPVLDYVRLYQDADEILKTFFLSDLDPHTMVQNLTDFQKQLLILVRSAILGARLILFHFFTFHLYTAQEFSLLEKIFALIRSRGIALLCFSSGYLPVFRDFDHFLILEDNVIIKNVNRKYFSPSDVMDRGSDPAFSMPAGRAENGKEVFSCRDLKLGDRTLSFSLAEDSCTGILDPALALSRVFRLPLENNKAFDASCFYLNGCCLKDQKKAFGKIALIDYGYDSHKVFLKMSLADNITVKAISPMYLMNAFLNRRVQRYLVHEVLEDVDRTDLLKACGGPKGRPDNLDAEDELVLEACRWLCIRPSVCIFHNFSRKYSLLASEKIGHLIRRIHLNMHIPVLLIAPTREELSSYCSDIIPL